MVYSIIRNSGNREDRKDTGYVCQRLHAMLLCHIIYIKVGELPAAEQAFRNGNVSVKKEGLSWTVNTNRFSERKTIAEVLR